MKFTAHPTQAPRSPRWDCRRLLGLTVAPFLTFSIHAADLDLHRAIRHGDTSAWRALLAASPDVHARDDYGDTPLHIAALRGDVDAVDALLKAGADAAARNIGDATPLHYGIGSERIAAALLARGAPADSVSKVGVTPLLGAVARPDSIAVARLLVAAGANVNHRRKVPIGPLGEASVLAIAVTGGDRRTIRLLLDAGAELNPKEGTSPLCAAAFAGDVESIKLLLDRGADINLRSGMLGSALNFALACGHDEAARLLIARGADSSITSIRGAATSGIIFSTYNDHGDDALARLLVKGGADINVANEFGETALSYALKRGDDTPAVRFLREAGAKPPVLIRADRKKDVPTRDIPADTTARAALIRDSAQRAVALLQRNSTAFLENGFVRRAQCVSCHQQSLPAVAFGFARERGLQVDEHELGRQLHATMAQLMRQVERARQMDEPTPAAGVTLGFELDGLFALRYPPDRQTDAMTHYLLAVQEKDGSWAAPVRRPPMGDGKLTSTAWTVRALQTYPPTGRERDAEDALRRARGWLAAQKPTLPNERLFQLLGLAWAGETPQQLRPFVDQMLAEQRADGGWAQLATWPSDAWATGGALVALHKSGIATSHPAYQRALDFLLRTQFDDGSWWVRSRAWPFQPHFDGQFPHGKDQWISAAGTAWAAIALLHTIDPQLKPEQITDPHKLVAAFVSAKPSAPEDTATAALTPLRPAAITFTRDIMPIVERSCADCHAGKKTRGDFSLATRDSLLKGGQSGEPAIVPGRSAHSYLVRYVSDQIEDLEMPPLAKRQKYPPLSPAEIALLREWIDAGAHWEPPSSAGGSN
jgi:ankyrin repeat protein